MNDLNEIGIILAANFTASRLSHNFYFYLRLGQEIATKDKLFCSASQFWVGFIDQPKLGTVHSLLAVRGRFT